MATTPPSYPFIYHDGFKVNIVSHRPPLPFGHRHYNLNQPSSLPPKPTQKESQIDYVFRHHPIRTEPVKHPQETSLTIIKRLNQSEADGAMVFIGKVSPHFKGQKGEVVFVKIYDPLYYSYAFLGIESVRNSVVKCADKDYSREAAAYEFMREIRHDGDSAPAYYGSWTFTAPPYQERTRPVRLIITEYIPAPSLYQAYYRTYRSNIRSKERMSPNERPDLSEKFRLRIMAHVLDLQARQLHLGLDQNDLAPRNIIVLLSGRKEDGLEKHSIQRVVLVDYNQSIVYPWSNQNFSPAKRPSNPIEKYWRCAFEEFEEWVPNDWHENPDRRREWLYATFGNSERYEPLSQETQADVRMFLRNFKRT